MDLFPLDISKLSTYFFAITIILNLSAIYYAIRRSIRNPDPILYRTCVLGAPYSGKTTLITRAFQEIFGDYVGRNVSLRGRNTIDIYTENSSRLEQGRPVLRTSISDVFVFRFDYERKSYSTLSLAVRKLMTALLNSVYRMLYKVEIADFAGELSLNASADEIDRVPEGGLPSDDLVRWALDAQNYVFVIDCSPNSFFEKSGLSQSQFCQRIWLHLNDIKIDKSGKDSERNVCLYFNKIDALIDDAFLTDQDLTPPVQIVDDDDIARVSSLLATDYKDLIAFFRSQSDRLRIIYGSSFATDAQNHFVGVRNFIDFTLPK